MNEGVRLRGSIDMVERNLFTRTLRVTDQKSGKAPEQVPAYVGGGRVLQPILYALAAEKLLGEKVEAGRLFYATQRGGYQHMLIPAGDASRRFLARLLQNIDGAIASGFLPYAPQKKTPAPFATTGWFADLTKSSALRATRIVKTSGSNR